MPRYTNVNYNDTMKSEAKNTMLIQASNEEWPTILIPPSAEKIRDGLLKLAKPVTAAKDEESTNLCNSVASELSGFLKGLESARKHYKEPALSFGKKIDSTAENFGAPVEKELNRIKGLLSARQMELARERQRIEEEARKKKEEADRLLRESELAAQKAAKTGSAMQEVKAERLEDKSMEVRIEAMQLSQTAEATKVRGGRMELDFQVTDIKAFYQAFPNYCTLEVKTRDTKELLKMLKGDGTELPSVPGLRVFEKASVSIR